jgi:cobalt-zinc-cadmium efflux system outer membrane protein
LGAPNLPFTTLAGSLEAALPEYDLHQASAIVLETHPEVRSAEVGVSRAQLELRRQEVEPVPNITLVAGYSKNFNDRQDQAPYQVGLPLPVWNRNQGNIRAAQAELGRAVQEVTRVQNDLLARLAAAFGQYAAARRRAERYRTAVLPATRRAYRLALDAFNRGQFERVRVLQAQRAVQDANLEYIRNLTEAWRAASEIADFLLEEQWPLSLLGPCETTATAVTAPQRRHPRGPHPCIHVLR